MVSLIFNLYGYKRPGHCFIAGILKKMGRIMASGAWG